MATGMIWQIQAPACRQLTHQSWDPLHTHTHTHTHATHTHRNTHTHTHSYPLNFFETSLCFCLPAPVVISSLLPTFSSPDTPPSHWALPPWNILLLTGSLCLCCYSNLAACSPSPSSLCGCGKKIDCPCVSTSGKNRNSLILLTVLAECEEGCQVLALERIRLFFGNINVPISTSQKRTRPVALICL